MTTENKPFEFRGAIVFDQAEILGQQEVLVLAQHIPSTLDLEIATISYDDESPLTREQATEFAQMLATAINNRHYLEQR